MYIDREIAFSVPVDLSVVTPRTGNGNMGAVYDSHYPRYSVAVMYACLKQQQIYVKTFILYKKAENNDILF